MTIVTASKYTGMTSAAGRETSQNREQQQISTVDEVQNVANFKFQPIAEQRWVSDISGYHLWEGNCRRVDRLQ